MSEDIETYIEVKQCDLDLYDALVEAIASNGPTISLIAQFRENAINHSKEVVRD